MKSKKKKSQTPMDKLTKNYNKFIKGKEFNEDGKSEFEKGLKNVSKPKPHDSK
jgi:hypothetical protein